MFQTEILQKQMPWIIYQRPPKKENLPGSREASVWMCLWRSLGNVSALHLQMYPFFQRLIHAISSFLWTICPWAHRKNSPANKPKKNRNIPGKIPGCFRCLMLGISRTSEWNEPWKPCPSRGYGSGKRPGPLQRRSSATRQMLQPCFLP